jgi:hypothetical protein
MALQTLTVSAAIEKIENDTLTIAGVKTFSSSPIVPTPTTDMQASTKKYVDEKQQVVNTQTGAVATGNTALPNDDTIPQITEGAEFMTLAVTPTSATNKLRIDVVCNISLAGAGYPIVALFQDATANALIAVNAYSYSTAVMECVVFTYYMTAGTTSETTFRVRAGEAAGGTITFNGVGGARKFGGVCLSSITITEIRA